MGAGQNRMVRNCHRLCLYVAVFLMTVVMSALSAQTWEWPDEMTLGGFRVTSIRGSVNEDGSGTASGLVQITGIPGQKVTLNRSASGKVAGNVAVSARILGAEIQGTFTLDETGLKSSSAMIKLVPKSVVEAVTTVSTNGVFSGTGTVPLGDLKVPVRFVISKESFTLGGFTAIQARTDTPLALYTFSGELKLDAGNAKIWITAEGSIQRTGKLTNQVSTTQVSDIPVNISDGTATANVDGVPVTFVFFGP